LWLSFYSVTLLIEYRRQLYQKIVIIKLFQTDASRRCSDILSDRPYLLTQKEFLFNSKSISDQKSPFLPGSYQMLFFSQSLPFQQFQVLLTLFSESFSSFPRGTCALSVSRPVVFSLRWSIPPDSGCTLKQPDSPIFFPSLVELKRLLVSLFMLSLRDFHPLWCIVPNDLKALLTFPNS